MNVTFLFCSYCPLVIQSIICLAKSFSDFRNSEHSFDKEHFEFDKKELVLVDFNLFLTVVSLIQLTS